MLLPGWFGTSLLVPAAAIAEFKEGIGVERGTVDD